MGVIILSLKKLFFSKDIQIETAKWSVLFELIPFDSFQDLPQTEDFGLLIRSTFPINRSTIGDKKIIFVASLTSGVDHVDQEYLKNKNIPFFYAAGHNAISVAEYVVESLYLHFINQIKKIESANIVIIGGGNIGTQIYTILSELNIKKINVVDPHISIEVAIKKGFSLKNLSCIEEADVITFHVPLIYEGTHATYRMLGEKFLSKCKKSPLIINTSRGKIAQEKDLLTALQKNTISKLIADVWEDERNPTKTMKELVKYAFIATPHLAGKSNLALRRGEIQLRKQIFSLCGISIMEDKNDKKYTHSVLPLAPVVWSKIQNEAPKIKEFTNQFQTLCATYDGKNFFQEFQRLRTTYENQRKEWSEVLVDGTKISNLL